MNRIKILDSFRCIGILTVMVDHYTSTFTKTNTVKIFPHIAQSLYPYGDKYKTYFQNGGFGFKLFFIISGFVIYMTLNRSESFNEFLKKRFLRIFPLLLICSIITFSLPYILDANCKYLMFHRPLLNFFPSLTFTDLWVWNKVFNVHSKADSIEYIDNVYWTLGNEMKFYIYTSTAYFIFRNNFFKMWLYFALSIMCIYICSKHFDSSRFFFYMTNLFETTFFAKYVIYFTLGIFFYRIYEKLPVSRFEYTLILLCLTISTLNFMSNGERLALVFHCILFGAFIYKPTYLTLLTSKPMLFIGTISYPLYLIHQNIGVLSINYLADTLRPNCPEVLIIPVIILMILLAYLLHVYVELPIATFVREKFNVQTKSKIVLQQ